jgi:DNA-binding transcriptional LysR family regulator
MKDSLRLDVRALRFFVAVAEKGSLSAASAELGVTQSALSQTVMQIEQILGAKVLDRTRRPLKLTAAGIALSRHARTIVDEMDQLIAQVREADLANRPEVRLGMIDSYAATVGPLVIKEMTLNASQVILWAGLAFSQASALLQRQVDLIVTSDPMDDMDKLVRRALFTEPFVVVLPKTQADRFAKADLMVLARELPLIRFSTRSHFGALTERHLRRCSITAPRHLEIDASDVVLSMVAADLGWAITTPLVLMQTRAYLKDVTVIPIKGPALTRTIYQVSREGEYMETTEYLYQASRRILESSIFPDIREALPWLGSQLHLN